MARVLLAGVSTRAAAESAARAGFAVTAVDAFADLDQHASVRALALPRRFTAHAAARAARDVECDAVAYGSSFENHPRAVAALAAGRTLWGNTPAVLRRVRDPYLVAQTLGRRGFPVPIVRSGEPVEPVALPEQVEPLDPSARDWLVKPLASGGGRRVRPWRRTDRTGGRRADRSRAARVPRGCYLQELVEGTPGSVVFVAAGGRAVPLGVSRQLIGETAFGATGYRYCGSILAPAGDAGRGDDIDDLDDLDDMALVDRACALARAVAEEFGLAGVNGIDFIARNGIPYAIEVNPRWCASMELVERAYGVSVFGAHAAACAAGALPDFDLARARRGASAVGKAVIFARRDVVVGDTHAWLAHLAVPAHPALPAHPAREIPEIHDVPRAGEEIAAGRPVCTVFAAGHDAASCHATLVRHAERVYADLAGWERRVA